MFPLLLQKNLCSFYLQNKFLWQLLKAIDIIIKCNRDTGITAPCFLQSCQFIYRSQSHPIKSIDAFGKPYPNQIIMHIIFTFMAKCIHYRNQRQKMSLSSARKTQYAPHCQRLSAYTLRVLSVMQLFINGTYSLLFIYYPIPSVNIIQTGVLCI